MTSLDDVLPCFSDRVALDTITGAREAIQQGIHSLNSELYSTQPTVTEYINEEYKKTTVMSMCGEKDGKFNEIGVDNNVVYDEYKALACNLYERNVLDATANVYERTAPSGYVQGWGSPGVNKMHSISLQDASAHYNSLDFSAVSGIKDMINVMPNIHSVARCKYVQFVARIAMEEDYVDPITAQRFKPRRLAVVSIVELFRNLSRGVAFDWFVVHFIVRRHDEIHVLMQAKIRKN